MEETKALLQNLNEYTNPEILDTQANKTQYKVATKRLKKQSAKTKESSNQNEN